MTQELWNALGFLILMIVCIIISILYIKRDNGDNNWGAIMLITIGYSFLFGITEYYYSIAP